MERKALGVDLVYIFRGGKIKVNDEIIVLPPGTMIHVSKESKCIGPTGYGIMRPFNATMNGELIQIGKVETEEIANQFAGPYLLTEIDQCPDLFIVTGIRYSRSEDDEISLSNIRTSEAYSVPGGDVNWVLEQNKPLHSHFFGFGILSRDTGDHRRFSSLRTQSFMIV